MQAENDDDLGGGQRSSKVKWGKLCDMATGHAFLCEPISVTLQGLQGFASFWV